tara:strand:+ start:255 stop:464 length:210 start_codon:yes stop_codon:yes gene_type:complete
VENHVDISKIQVNLAQQIEKKMMLAKLFSEFKEFGALKSENNEDSIDSIKHSAMIEIESEKPKKKEEVK